MKRIITGVLFLAAIVLNSCTTAHEVKEETKYAAKRTGHAVGHGLSHAGAELEEHTSR